MVRLFRFRYQDIESSFLLHTLPLVFVRAPCSTYVIQTAAAVPPRWDRSEVRCPCTAPNTKQSESEATSLFYTCIKAYLCSLDGRSSDFCNQAPIGRLQSGIWPFAFPAFHPTRNGNFLFLSKTGNFNPFVENNSSLFNIVHLLCIAILVDI